jgi:hypothetical protein
MLQFFLTGGESLVQRIKEGIYNVYGMGSNTADDKGQVNKQQNQSFNVHKIDYSTDHEIQIDASLTGQGCIVDIKTQQPVTCSSYVTKSDYKKLVRKALHAMVTEHTFLIAVVSSGDYTYQANNIFQAQVTQVQYLLQSVFDKLGIKVISRSMGMDTPTTTINALRVADIYKESDIYGTYQIIVNMVLILNNQHTILICCTYKV